MNHNQTSTSNSISTMSSCIFGHKRATSEISLYNTENQSRVSNLTLLLDDVTLY